MKIASLVAVTISVLMLLRARAEVIYSSLQNIVIPADFAGVYLDVDTGVTGINDDSPPPGWDINPFFGGVGVANSPSFQPARTGIGTTSPILSLSAGETIGDALNFSTGYGGSEGHLGSEFIAGEEGFLGFRFRTNGPSASGPYFGWMRVVFTEATPSAFIKDWAYENAGTPIVAGRVQQGSPVNGQQLVTLSPGDTESFILGSVVSDTDGNVNSLLKTGNGTTVLGGANTYSGSTTIAGGVLSISASSNLGDGSATNVIEINGGTLRNTGTGVNLGVNRSLTIGVGGAAIDVTAESDLTLSGAIISPGNVLTKTGFGVLTIETAVGDGTVIVNASAGTTNFSASQSLASLNIGADAIVTLTDQAPALGTLANFVETVPEPGSMSMLLAGFFALIGQRRRETQ